MNNHKELIEAVTVAREFIDDWSKDFALKDDDITKISNELAHTLAKAMIVSELQTAAASVNVASAATAMYRAASAGARPGVDDSLSHQQWQMAASESTDRFVAAFQNYQSAIRTEIGEWAPEPLLK